MRPAPSSGGRGCSRCRCGEAGGRWGGRCAVRLGDDRGAGVRSGWGLMEGRGCNGLLTSHLISHPPTPLQAAQVSDATTALRGHADAHAAAAATNEAEAAALQAAIDSAHARTAALQVRPRAPLSLPPPPQALPLPCIHRLPRPLFPAGGAGCTRGAGCRSGRGALRCSRPLPRAGGGTHRGGCGARGDGCRTVPSQGRTGACGRAPLCHRGAAGVAGRAGARACCCCDSGSGSSSCRALAHRRRCRRCAAHTPLVCRRSHGRGVRQPPAAAAPGGSARSSCCCAACGRIAPSRRPGSSARPPCTRPRRPCAGGRSRSHCCRGPIPRWHADSSPR